MSISLSRALTGASAAVAASLYLSPAYAHAVCGSRIFPATLGIDDPGVGDEVALPTITYLPHNGDGAEEFDITGSWTKTIFPNFGLSITDGPTWVRPGGYGWPDINTEAKYNFFCIPELEFMGSVGLNVDWGHTYVNGMGNDFNTYSPTFNAGMGFGFLPKTMNALRPFAITTEVSYDIPSQRVNSDASQNPYNINWGFAIQYSLPYYNANVGAINNDFFKHLIPITEFTFSRPVSNFAPGTNITTGTVQPGVIYMADTWQFALEAVIPINGASGHGTGVIGELHFFLDDIFPNSLGKPLFGGKS